MSSFRALGGRLYEKILSRYQKSSIWTLKPASPCPSASSPRHIGTASRRQARKLTKRLISIFPLNNPPDGKASTLLTSTTRERSVLPVKKTVAAVPVSSRNTTQERSTGKAYLLLFCLSVPLRQFLGLVRHLPLGGMQLPTTLHGGRTGPGAATTFADLYRKASNTPWCTVANQHQQTCTRGVHRHSH